MNLRHQQHADRSGLPIGRVARAIAGAVLALGAAAGIAVAPAAAANASPTAGTASARTSTSGQRAKAKVSPKTVVAAPASSHLSGVSDVVSGRVHPEASPDAPGSAFISFSGLTDMGPTDDGSSPQAVPLGFTLDYFGSDYTSVWVNENGNLTFTGRLSTYTPSGIGTVGTDIIGPFFADADSNNGGATTLYGATTLDGYSAFVAEWPYVDCYTDDGTASDTEDDFEVVLINRPDLGTGDFQIEYNYDQIQWDAGEASDGTTSDPVCQSQTNADAAVVGFSNASGSESYELPGSQSDGAFIDSNQSTGLIYNDVNSDTPVSVPASEVPVQGRYIWEVENGSLGTPTNLSGSLTSTVESGTSITVPPGTAVSATASLTGDQVDEATGTVSYTIYSGAGCTGSVYASAGTGNVSGGSVGGSSAVSISAPGTYSWYASYSGDHSNNQASASCIGTETVSQPATTTSNTVHTSGSTTGATAFDVATVTPVSGGATPTGTATFALYGSAGCGSTALQTSGPTALSGGSAQSATSLPLSAGTYYYQATYTPAEGSTYNGSTSACTSFSLTAGAPSAYTTQQFEGNGSSWTGNEVHPITHYEVASVTGVTGVDPTGSVTFSLFSGSATCTGTPAMATVAVSGGSGSSPTASAQSPTTGTLTAGSYSYSANYSGDGNYSAASSGCVAFSVGKASTAVTASPNPSSTMYGNTVQLSAGSLPGDATGTVTFSSNGSPLCSMSVSNGGATCTTSVLAAGSYPVTATYSGDVNYEGSSTTTSFTISQAATTLTATANPTSTTYGNTVQLSASGLPTGSESVLAATGTVTFTITGTETTLCSNAVSAGGATCTTGVLAAATYPVTATYSGDSNYSGSSNTTSFVVNKAATTLTATANPTSTTYGNTVQLSASGLPTGGSGVLAATGTVTFTITGTETTLCSNAVSDGGASCTTGYLGAASYAVTATYSGDTNYLGSSNTTSFVVNKAPTSFTAGSAPGSTSHPNTVLLSATGLPVPDGPLPATGTVSFTVDGLPLCTGNVADGSASCTTAAMAAGTYNVTGTYSGDSNYLGSTATTTFTITQGGTAFTASATPTSTSYGNPVQLAVSGLPSDATGNVTFTAGASTLCVAGVWTGAAACSTGAVPAGNYHVTATYSGDQNYTSSTASTSFTITRGPITSFDASATPQSAIYPDAVVLTGSALPSNATGTVVFTSGGSTLCAATVSGGSASCSSGGRPAGVYRVTATYSGDSNYVGTTASTAFVVNAGFWLPASDGGVFSFGGSRFRGSTEEAGYTTAVKGKVVAMTSTPDGFGYWLVTDQGQVLPFGDAGSYGDLFTIGKAGSLAAPIVGIAATPDGGGYWLVAGDGGVFGFGDAHFHGDTYTIGKESSLAAPVVGIAATPDGGGYWLTAGDGGVFGFGDAHFTGDTYTDGQAGHLSGSVVGIASSPDGLGYWLATSEGEVLIFGDARQYGDIFTIGLNGHLRGPVVGIPAFPRQLLPVLAERPRLR
jgi:hypothetical protein